MSETRTVYSGKGNLVNVRQLWNMQSRWLQREHSQFYFAWGKNHSRIQSIYEMRSPGKELQEELALRLKHDQIFEEYHKHGGPHPMHIGRLVERRLK